jgi:dihydrofolate reductase
MGRKTFDSIGKPLPGRRNIVISRRRDLEIPGCAVVDSLDAAIASCEFAGESIAMIIGGAEIYAQALPRADVIYLTEVHASFEGDVMFPSFDKTHWREVSREAHSIDEKHAYAFSFVKLERIR